VIARLAALAAFGFILPGPVLLRQYAERRSEAVPSDLAVDGTLSLWGDDARAFAVRAGLTLAGERQDRLDLPAQLRLEQGRCTLTLGEPGRPLGRLSNDRGRVDGADAAQASGLAGATAFARDGCAPLLWRGTDAAAGLEGFLQAQGGSADDVSLTRFDGRVAYAIGGPANGSGKVAFVFSQEGYRPLRLLLHEGAAAVDVRYAEYAPVCFDGGFPARISVWQDGAPLAVFAATLPVR